MLRWVVDAGNTSGRGTLKENEGAGDLRKDGTRWVRERWFWTGWVRWVRWARCVEKVQRMQGIGADYILVQNGLFFPLSLRQSVGAGGSN